MEDTPKMKPYINAIWWLGIWMGRITTLTQSHPWAMVKLLLEPLSDFKDIKDIDFVGYDAENFENEFGKYYESIDKIIDPIHLALLQGKVEYWRGKLEAIFPRMIICQPVTHMDIVKLRRGAIAFLEAEEWYMLQPLEKDGLNEATSCLLFNNFTSSEFIALRTVESLLRRWYEKETSKIIEDSTWGMVIKKLDEEFPVQKRPKEISYLYFLKERRDSVAHPEFVSSENDAMLTFLQVIRACKLLRKKLLS